MSSPPPRRWWTTEQIQNSPNKIPKVKNDGDGFDFVDQPTSDVSFADITGNPTDNEALASAWSAKQNIFTPVANYAALPDPTLHNGEFYYAQNSQGTKWLPGSLGGTYYPKGVYYSNGIGWVYDEMPYQADQTTVDTGTVTDQFITPATLNNYSGWNKTKVGLSNVDNTSDATKNSAIATLTNKTISGSNNTLSDISTSSLSDNAVTQAKTAQYSAYTIWGNSTGSSANASNITFKEVSEQDVTAGTISWDGTPPINLLNGKYEWYQIGSQVTLRIRLSYNAAGVSNTTVTIPLPTGVPTPAKPTGFAAANTSMYWGTGGIATSNTGFISNNSKVVLGNDSAGTGYEIRASSATLAAKVVNLTVTYTAV